jgi:hypothetical protein
MQAALGDPGQIEKAIKLVNKWKGKIVDNDSGSSKQGADNYEATQQTRHRLWDDQSNRSSIL